MSHPYKYEPGKRDPVPDPVVEKMRYGFPLHRGGPMHYADEVGLSEVTASMRKFGWEPARSLVK